MNITHIITGLETGGAEHSLMNLLSGGLAGNLNRVISLGDIGPVGCRIQETGVSITSLGMGRGRPTLSGLSMLKKTIQEHPADILQGWMYHGNLAALFARKYSKNNPALFWNIRQSLYDLSKEKWLTRQVIRLHRRFSDSPSGVIYNSMLSKQQHERFGIDPHQSIVIPNGINTNKFCFSEKIHKEVRAALNIPLNAIVIGHVARFHHMKDHETFLKAAGLVIKKHPEIHFLMCGRDVTDDNEDLKKHIANIPKGNICLLGEREDISDLMSAMNIFCQSSWSEAFPTVLCEAMSTSMPCVTTSVGDSASIVGDTGVLIPPKDPPSLADGLIKYITLPKEERRSLGRKARNRIEENYNLEANVNSYTRLYEGALSTAGAT